MKLRMMIGLALAGAALTFWAVGHARSGSAPSAPSGLLGTWRLDAAASESPSRPEGGERGGFRRREGDGGRWAPPEGSRPRMRGRLPDVLKIESAGNTLSLEDSAGAMVQQIAIGKEKSNEDSDEAVRVQGSWKEDKLEVKRVGPRGSKLTERYYLADDGRTLVVERKAEMRGHTREWKRVYRRVAS